MKKDKRIANSTFILRLEGGKDNKWSGKIKLVDFGIEKQFGSALELIRIMDDAVEGRE